MEPTQNTHYLESLSRVTRYIEEHFQEPLTLEELARVAGFSKYHFHRLFCALTGESPGEYLRRVRISSTTLRLKGAQSITQIALESGYETNASFSKAFKRHFGLSPRAFARQHTTLQGEHTMQPEIVTLDEINVIYVRATGAYPVSVETAWGKLITYAYDNALAGEISSRYGIGHDNPDITQSEKIRYDACIALKEGVPYTPSGEVASKTLKGGRYAKFLHIGPYEALGETHQKIADWIVQSQTALRDTPTIDRYLDLDPRGVEPQKLRTEIYLPLV